MAKSLYGEDFEFSGKPVHVGALRIKGEAGVDYHVWTSLTDRTKSEEPVATIWRDAQQPRTHEWVVTWVDESRSSRRWGYFPTLASALSAIGQRAAKDA